MALVTVTNNRAASIIVKTQTIKSGETAKFSNLTDIEINDLQNMANVVVEYVKPFSDPDDGTLRVTDGDLSFADESNPAGVTLSQLIVDNVGVGKINDIPPEGDGNFTLEEGPNITITPGANKVIIEASDAVGVATVNSEDPVAGDIDLVEGDNITISPGVPGAGQITIDCDCDEDSVLTIENVSPDYSGNIDLVEGANMTITPNPGANSITFASSGGAGGITIFDAIVGAGETYTTIQAAIDAGKFKLLLKPGIHIVSAPLNYTTERLYIQGNPYLPSTIQLATPVTSMYSSPNNRAEFNHVIFDHDGAAYVDFNAQEQIYDLCTFSESIWPRFTVATYTYHLIATRSIFLIETVLLNIGSDGQYSNIVFEACKFEMNGSSSPVTIIDSSYATFESCLFSNISGAGLAQFVDISGSSHYNSFTSCRFWQALGGVATNAIKVTGGTPQYNVVVGNRGATIPGSFTAGFDGTNVIANNAKNP